LQVAPKVAAAAYLSGATQIKFDEGAYEERLKAFALTLI